MSIKILAVDMDGTTLNSQNTLSAGNQEVLQRAINAGVLVVPATGRQFSGLPPQLEKINGIRYYLCSNGAVVYDRMQQKILHQDLMSCELALRALTEISSYKSSYMDLYINGKAYTSKARYQDPLKYGVSVLHEKTFLASRIPVDDIAAFLTGTQSCPEKIFSIFNDTDDFLTCWKKLETWPEVSITNSINNSIEVTHCTATKGEGLKALAGLLNVPRDSVMAVGDGLNDISMLDWAKTSVAMGNADGKVCEHASFKTADCDHDGLAKAIERFVFC